jgi:hypothetical protein
LVSPRHQLLAALFLLSAQLSLCLVTPLGLLLLPVKDGQGDEPPLLLPWRASTTPAWKTCPSSRQECPGGASCDRRVHRRHVVRLLHGRRRAHRHRDTLLLLFQLGRRRARERIRAYNTKTTLLNSQRLPRPVPPSSSL